MTENPRVVQGFIDIYGDWIDGYRVDGFRIDTARHVNPEFWRAFVPAMLKRARAKGMPNFHIFGEVAAEGVDVAQLARHTRVDKLPSVLDFGFAGCGAGKCWRGNAGTSAAGAPVCRRWSVRRRRAGGAATADLHRQSRFRPLRLAGAAARGRRSRDDEMLQRVMLSNAMLFLLRGVPVVYYGDEQGFVGHGIDQAARQDMFASQVASYNDQSLLGTASTTCAGQFRRAASRCTGRSPRSHHWRKQYAALRRGRQVVRAQSKEPGLFAASRIGSDGREILLAFNTSTLPLTRRWKIEAGTRAFKALHGDCPRPDAPGSVKMQLQPFGLPGLRGGAP